MGIKCGVGALLLIVFFWRCGAGLSAQPMKVESSGELELQLEKLNVLGSVLYLAAHPDDENTAAIAYFSKGRLYRTAYLSVTRGDGGQNLIGAEKGAEIGMLRTQELLEARRLDGGEQFFTRAIDFGYSKTPEETFTFWDHEKVLADIVWVIRNFRPDIIATRFPIGGNAGHGHHTASGTLAKEAFSAAADPGRFPEQLQYVAPWQAKRLLWNSWRPGQEVRKDLMGISIGTYNPLLGLSFTEISALSRSMHKSQGFGSSGRRGESFDYFEVVDGEPAASDVFDGINTAWTRVPGGGKIGTMLERVIAAFETENPSKSIPGLLDIYDEMAKIGDNYWIEVKRKEILRVIRGCAGLWMEAIAEDYSAAPGDGIPVRLNLVNRSDFPLTLEKMEIAAASFDTLLSVPLKNNEPFSLALNVGIPSSASFSQPYWLREESTEGMFSISNQREIGMAEDPPSLSVQVTLQSGNHALGFPVPVLYRWTDRADGELYRPFEIRPPVTVNFENKVLIFTGGEAKKINAVMKNYISGASGTLRLACPAGWKAEPVSIPFTMGNRYSEEQVSFTLYPPAIAEEVAIKAEVLIGNKEYDRSLVEISYPHIRRLVYFPESSVRAVKLDMEKPGGSIGYIMGAGDEVPEVIASLGYDVTLLPDEVLENGDLSRFKAIVTGIRAYNTRARLRHSQGRLIEYVKNGGTLIVQYNVSSGLVTNDIGPYPFTIGRERVSDETAPVSFVNPSHRLLSFPNKITSVDFEGWVQERGLYFADQWDERYEAVLSAHDPGEPDRPGGTLFAQYGKGIFIFSGYAWFRELPAGVPGACRLFVNMLEAGRYDGPERHSAGN